MYQKRIIHTPFTLTSFFFPLSARGPTRRRNSTGLAELWGGWPIERALSLLLAPWFLIGSYEKELPQAEDNNTILKDQYFWPSCTIHSSFFTVEISQTVFL